MKKHLNKKTTFFSKKGFTLVEMLIVIIIIGILAAALIPRLTGARSRANDTARRADLNQLSTALISYQMEKGDFPTCSGGAVDKACTVDLIADGLKNYGGMSSIPAESIQKDAFSGIAAPLMGNIITGNYVYSSVKKNGLKYNGFILMAQMETMGGANYVQCPGGLELTGGTDVDTIYTCDTIDVIPSGCTSATATNKKCAYVRGSSVLRYVVKY